MGGVIRAARPEDEAAVLALVRELAEYERMPPDVVRASVPDDAAALFPPYGVPAHVGCHLGEVDGEVVGFALWYPPRSRPGPASRGCGSTTCSSGRSTAGRASVARC